MIGSGRVAVITGAARGIGKRTAEVLGERGYSLLLNDLQREQAEERDTLRSILDKLPDEHTMRAIALTDD